MPSGGYKRELWRTLMTRALKSSTALLLNIKGRDFVVLWHEAMAKRLAKNVVSAWIKCINVCEGNDIVF